MLQRKLVDVRERFIRGPVYLVETDYETIPLRAVCFIAAGGILTGMGFMWWLTV